ncbi:hypothetical protein Tco_0503384 [Tanacetum coccineum]
MDDNSYYGVLVEHPTEGYEDAIVVPEITANNFEIKHGLLNLVQNKKFFGHDKEDPHAHIRYFNKITSYDEVHEPYRCPKWYEALPPTAVSSDIVADEDMLTSEKVNPKNPEVLSKKLSNFLIAGFNLPISDSSHCGKKNAPKGVNPTILLLNWEETYATYECQEGIAESFRHSLNVHSGTHGGTLRKVHLNKPNELRDHATENSVIFKEENKDVPWTPDQKRVFNVVERILKKKSHKRPVLRRDGKDKDIPSHEGEKKRVNELSELRDQAYENSLIYKEKTKKLHDSKIKNRIFNVGDQVLLFNSRLKIFSGKLKSRWSGPFTITKVYPYGTAKLSHADGSNFKVNCHRLKHYYGGDTPPLDRPNKFFEASRVRLTCPVLLELLILSPPISLSESTPSVLVPILRRTARMAVRVPPAMSSVLSASITEVVAISKSAFHKRFMSSYESSPSVSPLDLHSLKRYRGTSELVEDSKEDEEIEDSLDSNCVGEDAEDEGSTTEDEDPAVGDEGLATGVEGPDMDDESYGLDNESHGMDDEDRGLGDEGHSIESDGLGLEEDEEVVLEGQQQAAPVVGTTVSAPLGLGYRALRRRELALEEDDVYGMIEVGQGSGSSP